MIDSIIAAFLRAGNRLVVPDFGTFIRKENGEMVFVEFLKKDDGVLTGLVGKELGLSEDEAREVVAQYVANVRRMVGMTGRYTVEGLGALTADANGVLSLDAEAPVQSTPKAAMPEPIVMAQEPVRMPEMKVEPVVAPASEPVKTAPPIVELTGEAISVVEMPASAAPREELREEPVTKRELIFDLMSSVSESTAEPVVEPRIEPQPISEPEPIVFRQSAWEPQPTVQEPVRAAETEPEPEPEKKTFTLNDLYAAPAEQPEPMTDWFGSMEDDDCGRNEDDYSANYKDFYEAPAQEYGRAESQRHEATHSRATHNTTTHHPAHKPTHQSAHRQPQIRRPAARRGKNRTDIVMIIAIAAAVIAIGSMIYGLLHNNNPAVRQSTEQVQQQQQNQQATGAESGVEVIDVEEVATPD